MKPSLQSRQPFLHLASHRLKPNDWRPPGPRRVGFSKQTIHITVNQQQMLQELGKNWFGPPAVLLRGEYLHDIKTESCPGTHSTNACLCTSLCQHIMGANWRHSPASPLSPCFGDSILEKTNQRTWVSFWFSQGLLGYWLSLTQCLNWSKTRSATV